MKVFLYVLQINEQVNWLLGHHKPAYMCLGRSHLALYHNTASQGSNNPPSSFPTPAAFVPSWLGDSPEYK
jgi:hypothetical protein